MKIIPAIDLYQGSCVRLKQGAFDAATQYETDPIKRALAFENEGADTLHIVDLEGAKKGLPQQQDIILKIKQSTNLTVQVGGGFRTQETIIAALESGIDRIVIGSLAVKDIPLVRSLIDTYSADRFVLAFDTTIKDEPLIAINGWQETTTHTLWDILQQYQDYTGLAILCTDISRDGMLQGPNFELYKECQQRFPNFAFQASGGISQLSNLTQLKKINVSATIVGKALYEKRFSLREALC